MQDLSKAYRMFFGEKTDLYRIFSPYRICPLGAHVDHQHGLVSGFAFDEGIDFLFSETESGKVEMCSLTFEGLITFNVRQSVGERQANWGDYLRGAVWAMQMDFSLRKGIRGVVKGSMPIGGLSSSAALLVGCVKAIAKANGIELTDLQVIRYASQAERDFVGLKNGILDQACVVLCKKNHLLYLDTKDGDYELIPFAGNADMEPPFKLGIFFSGVTRNLKGTDYNLRVAECKTSAWMVEAYENLPLKELESTFLRDIPEDLYKRHMEQMPERFSRRAAHFYGECNRVKEGVDAWKKGDLTEFGRIMFSSCASSRDLYECGSPELIALNEIAQETPGIYGGRFSGAGFKGAYIALVDPTKVKEIGENMRKEYLKGFPQYEDSYENFFCDTCDGARFV